MAPLSYVAAEDQKVSLRKLAELTRRGIQEPLVLYSARAIVQECTSRNDECELKALYSALKQGTPRVPGLHKGLRYTADPLILDWFTGPKKILELCAKSGACGADCDEHAALMAAFCAAIGFYSGLRAWGPKTRPDYTHVYAIVGYPKRRPNQWIGMDTTVPQASVGWEPPQGKYMTALIDPPSGWKKWSET